jgi:hypothetical protein
LKITLLMCPLVVLAPAGGLALATPMSWGTRNAGTLAAFAGSLAIPLFGLIVALLTILAMRQHASRLLVTYAAAVAAAMGGLSLYLSSYGLIGVRVWVH